MGQVKQRPEARRIAFPPSAAVTKLEAPCARTKTAKPIK
jgi:hypothetical protein